jgi:hypothetical protein
MATNGNDGYPGAGYRVTNVPLPPRSNGLPRPEGKIRPVPQSEGSTTHLMSAEEFRRRYNLPEDNDAAGPIEVRSGYGTGLRRRTTSLGEDSAQGGCQHHDGNIRFDYIDLGDHSDCSCCAIL